MMRSSSFRHRWWGSVAVLALVACGGATPGEPSAGVALFFAAQPQSAGAGAPIVVSVAVLDASGATVKAATDSISLTIGTNPGAGTLTGVVTGAATSGVATFSTLNIDKVGKGYTLVANATGLTSATSNAFDVLPAAASRLIFTAQPTSTVAGATISPNVTVTVQDASGNTVAGSTASVTLALVTSSGATLAGTSTNNASDGVATFSGLSIAKAGVNYRLVAGAAGLVGDTSTAFSVTAGVPTQFTFAVQPGNAFPNGPMSPAPVAAVEDAYGNPVLSASGTVTLAIASNPGGGTLTGNAALPLTNGMATFDAVNINSVGSGYTLSATLSGFPTATSGSFNVLSVTGIFGGVYHNCFIAGTGAAFCWGHNNAGQVGNGSTSDQTKPVAAASGLQFTTLALGSQHTCGLTPAGAAYCWGYNVDGELGNGSNTNSGTAVAVSGGLTFQSISAGAGHTCGVTTDSAAYCWGYNLDGELGSGPGASANVPKAVAGGIKFASVSAGDFHACGLTASGVAECWGLNSSGQLGNNTTTNATTPVAVSGGLTFGSLRAGSFRTCGVTAGGGGYCWGNNTHGQLGGGSALAGMARAITPQPIAGAHTFLSISTGIGEHACAVGTGGDGSYCWGYNLYGQLGLGNTVDQSQPVSPPGGLSFVSLIAGYYHSCGLATDQTLYCWGFNGHGELGIGSFASSGTLVKVLAP